MSITVSIHLRERPTATVCSNARYGHPSTHDWIECDGLTIHCRSEAQAILLADAINLPDVDPIDTAKAALARSGEAVAAAITSFQSTRDPDKDRAAAELEAQGFYTDLEETEIVPLAGGGNISRSQDDPTGFGPRAIHPEDGQPFDAGDEELAGN